MTVPVTSETCYWSVQAVDGAYAGSPFAEEESFQLTGVEEDTGRLPAVFFLGPAIPNPFNPITEISYGIPTGSVPSRLVINVYDAAGRRVTTLVDADQGPGTYRVVWDGKDHRGFEAGSGVYFYRLAWNGKVQTRRMILMK